MPRRPRPPGTHGAGGSRRRRVLARLVRISALPLLIAVLGPGPAAALEVSLHFSAVESAMRAAVFSEDGRTYLFGGPDSPCFHASLGDPKVSSIGGKVAVRLLFSGSVGREFRGGCVGAEEEFFLTVTGTPAYRGGVFLLDDLRVRDHSGVPLFDEEIDRFVAERLGSFLRFDLDGALRAFLDEHRDDLPYSVSYRSLRVPRIEVVEDRMILEVDLDLSVR